MPVVDTPTRALADELIEKITTISDELRTTSEENEQRGFVSDVTFKLLEDAGLTRAIAPESLGGLELGPYDSVRVYEVLARVETALQWVAQVPGNVNLVLHYLPDETVAAMCQNGLPYIAGQFAPNGKAEIVDGGYRVSGKWQYGSGIAHAQYVDGGALVTRDGKLVLGDNGQPQILVYFTPRENVTLAGNWETVGLRATGSVDYVLDKVFVAEGFTIPLTKLMAPVQQGAPRAQLVSSTGWLTAFHGAAALGAGRRMLDELGAFARKPSSRGVRLADDSRFATEYAKCEMRLRSARAYLLNAWAELQDGVNRGVPASRSVMTDIKAATVHLHDINVENAVFAFREAGGTSLRQGSFQRAYGDIMAMGQHVSVAQSLLIDCAADFLGEAEGKTWGFFGFQ